jgi:hypothetical protein
MKLPAVRLTITPIEFELLRPGLRTLTNDLVTTNPKPFLDSYPLPGLIRVHNRRRYDPAMAQRLVNIRHKLWGRTLSRKIWVDVFEVSALALALRVSRSTATSPTGRGGYAALAHKLEIYRKRARRAAYRSLGQMAFDESNNHWKRFVSWCRFNFVPALTMRVQIGTSKMVFLIRRVRLAEMIRRTLENRHFAVKSESDMKRVVQLVYEELCRRRHPIRLRELLAVGWEKGSELLFKLVSKKLNLTPLPGASLPLCVLASQRAEIYAAEASVLTSLSSP